MPTFEFLKNLLGSKPSGGEKSKSNLNLCELKDANSNKSRGKDKADIQGKKRKSSEGRIMDKASAVAFFQGAAFGDENEEQSGSRKSQKLGKENSIDDRGDSKSPSSTKSAKNKKERKIDLRNKYLVKHKKRLRQIRN